MVYPLAPWTLQGIAVQTLQVLEIDRVRLSVPACLEIVSLLPGKTVGGLYLASYGEGSALQYNELIVISAIVRYANTIGCWISHIYVDQPDSIAGGQDIWALPKQLAQFEWTMADKPSVRVSQDNNLICSLNCTWKLPGWRQSLTIPTLTVQDSKTKVFNGHAAFNLHAAGSTIQIPSTAPFAQLGLGQPWLSAYCSQLRLTVEAPSALE
jgi:hypothetical protein